MKEIENQKVYVKATYICDHVHSYLITHDIVLQSLLDDVNYYTSHGEYEHKVVGDKLVVKLKKTNITYELFICNFYEISNYLH